MEIVNEKKLVGKRLTMSVADFKPTNEFERWATVEVADVDNMPNEMDTFVLSSGLYAVFDYIRTRFYQMGMPEFFDRFIVTFCHIKHTFHILSYLASKLFITHRFVDKAFY